MFSGPNISIFFGPAISMFLGPAISIDGFANVGCSLLQCPVSQLCSWQAQSKQAKTKNLDVEDENDFEDV